MSQIINTLNGRACWISCLYLGQYRKCYSIGFAGQLFASSVGIAPRKRYIAIADKDPLGRQIQDAGLKVRKRALKTKKTASILNHVIDKENSEQPEFE